jgi:hypothetical protein
MARSHAYRDTNHDCNPVPAQALMNPKFPRLRLQARSLDNTFAVITVLRRCDFKNPITLTVACTIFTYVKYNDNFYQVYYNMSTSDEGIMDKNMV